MGISMKTLRYQCSRGFDCSAMMQAPPGFDAALCLNHEQCGIVPVLSIDSSSALTLQQVEMTVDDCYENFGAQLEAVQQNVDREYQQILDFNQHYHQLLVAKALAVQEKILPTSQSCSIVLPSVGYELHSIQERDNNVFDDSSWSNSFSRISSFLKRLVSHFQ